jgi:hypothetical protein
MAELLTSPALPTFRDPAGSVEIRPDGAYRSVHAPFDTEILAFLGLPIATELVEEGRLVASEVVSRASDETLLLRHPRISFQSYPWEWAPGLWLAAAELTLNLCSDLVQQGWLLKDATPLNVLFQGTEPIFVDVLSIERMDPHQPIWLAYPRRSLLACATAAAGTLSGDAAVAAGNQQEDSRWESCVASRKGS